MPSAPVYVASDHRGFKLKQALLRAMPELTDLGPTQYDPADDYNDAAIDVARRVTSEQGAFGILICGSAIGVSIQANRFQKVRAAVALDAESVQKTREHNDANVLCLSADTLSEAQAEELVRIFLTTPFSGEERHIRRIKRLDEEIA